MEFDHAKKRAMFKYREALQNNLVDEGIIELNSTINNLTDYFTTSSCKGRGILIEKNTVRSKHNTIFHFKTHDPNHIEYISSILFTSQETNGINLQGDLWFLLEAPNLHIRCRNVNAAISIHKLALQAKLGLSKYQSLEPTIVVEILGTGRMQIPFGKEGKMVIQPDFLEVVVNEAKKLLEEDQQRLQDFQRHIVSLQEAI